jgi:hypothetical protein
MRVDAAIGVALDLFRCIFLNRFVSCVVAALGRTPGVPSDHCILNGVSDALHTCAESIRLQSPIGATYGILSLVID